MGCEVLLKKKLLSMWISVGCNASLQHRWKVRSPFPCCRDESLEVIDGKYVNTFERQVTFTIGVWIVESPLRVGLFEADSIARKQVAVGHNQQVIDVRAPNLAIAVRSRSYTN